MTDGIQRKSKVRYLRKIVLFEKTVRTTYKRHTQYGRQEGDDETCQEVFQAHKQIHYTNRCRGSSRAPHTSLPAAGSTIDGIGCNPMEQAVFHVHAHLDIIINGVYFLVPSQIGIPSSCFYWLHTHDESGIIHIEAPMHRDFTLGQFFDIWGKKLSSYQIFTYVADANNPLNTYINGTKVPDGTNYRDIKLHAHDEIAIIYGTPPSTIPSSFKFPEGL